MFDLLLVRRVSFALFAVVASLSVTSDFGCANPIRALLAAPAPSASRTVRFDASVDRIEEDRLVLDVAGYPSLPVPIDLDASLREGSAVTVEVFVRAADDARAKELLVLEAGDPLRLELVGARPFRWPAPLAPRAETGGRLWMRLADDPVRAAHDSRVIETLRFELHGP